MTTSTIVKPNLPPPRARGKPTGRGGAPEQHGRRQDPFADWRVLYDADLRRGRQHPGRSWSELR